MFYVKGFITSFLHTSSLVLYMQSQDLQGYFSTIVSVSSNIYLNEYVLRHRNT